LECGVVVVVSVVGIIIVEFIVVDNGEVVVVLAVVDNDVVIIDSEAIFDREAVESIVHNLPVIKPHLLVSVAVYLIIDSAMELFAASFLRIIGIVEVIRIVEFRFTASVDGVLIICGSSLRVIGVVRVVVAVRVVDIRVTSLEVITVRVEVILVVRLIIEVVVKFVEVLVFSALVFNVADFTAFDLRSRESSFGASPSRLRRRRRSRSKNVLSVVPRAAPFHITGSRSLTRTGTHIIVFVRGWIAASSIFPLPFQSRVPMILHCIWRSTFQAVRNGRPLVTE